MNKLQSIAIAIFILLYSGAAYSGVVTTGWMHIEQIQLGWNVKRVNIYFDQELPNPASCSTSSSASIDEDQVNLDHIYALSLASFSAHKQIQIIITDESCSNNGRPKIISINSKY